MATPPVFPRKGEALAILGEELARIGQPAGPAPADPALVIEKQKRPGSQKLAWWHADVSKGDVPEADAPETNVLETDGGRSLAYLRAYVRITGGRPLPAGGLKLHKDRVWMDKAIVSSLEREGFLAFEPTGHFEPSFVVTEKGRHWIATGEVLT